jgi:phenylacetate-CoA ligase
MFDAGHESMRRAELEQLQLERLQALLARLRRNVPRQRERLGDCRVESLKDLAAVPPTSSRDLAAAFPYGMFALPLREVIRLQSVVGPGGVQLVVGHTRNDLTQWGRLVARQLVAAEVSGHDVIQICFGTGVVGRSVGYLAGAERIEASVIPQDDYHIEYQLAMMQSFRASVLITSPSNARELMQVLAMRGMDPQSLNLRAVLLSRLVSDEERQALRVGLMTNVRCSFGVAEVLDPGLCVECPEGRLHVNEDHFLAEAVDGELLITTLTREAMPLVRYRTRTAASLFHATCSCGRTGICVKPGERLDGRLRVNEMPLYRDQVPALLSRTRAAGHPFLLNITEDEIEVCIRMSEALFPDTIRELEALRRQIESEFLARLGVRARVAYLGPHAFDEQQRAEVQSRSNSSAQSMGGK